MLGEDWDPQECGFGTTTKPQSLLYCGPYVFTAHTKGASLTMVKNTEYWDVGNVQIDKVDYVYNSGTDATSLVEMFKKGELASLGVSSSNYDLVEDAYGEDYIYEQGTGTTTYYFNWNINRQTYAVGDCVSGKTTNAQKENTRKAILNENFRKAVFSAIPKVELNALQDDEDTALVCIRNTYTTPEAAMKAGNTYGQKIRAIYNQLVAVTVTDEEVDKYFGKDIPTPDEPKPTEPKPTEPKPVEPESSTTPNESDEPDETADSSMKDDVSFVFKWLRKIIEAIISVFRKGE